MAREAQEWVWKARGSLKSREGGQAAINKTMGHAVPDLDAIGIKADHDLADQFRREVAQLLGSFRRQSSPPVAAH
jgi:hypothetical protein